MNGSLKQAQRWCHVVAWASLCALPTGCRNNPQLATHIQVLNAERRVLEDRLFELEHCFERQAAELEDAQAELKRLRSEPRSRSYPRGDTAPSTAPSGSSQPTERPEEEFDLSPPVVTPGVPDEPRIEMPELQPPRSESSLRTPPGDTPVSAPATQLQPGDPRITHIHLDPQQTGGADFDQQPGEDGISVVIEPRNASDEFVPLSGPVSVVVLDYAKSNTEEARLARWDLAASQIDGALRNNASERGIHLLLPWRERRPENNRLLLAVRYTTVDGRKLEARRDIFVTLPGQYSQRWTPRSSSETENQTPAGLNVARQPSATDGAATAPSAKRTDEVEPPVQHASFATEAAAAIPVWRPTR